MKNLQTPPSEWMAVFCVQQSFVVSRVYMVGKKSKAALKNAEILVY